MRAWVGLGIIALLLVAGAKGQEEDWGLTEEEQAELDAAEKEYLEAQREYEESLRAAEDVGGDQLPEEVPHGEVASDAPPAPGEDDGDWDASSGYQRPVEAEREMIESIEEGLADATAGHAAGLGEADFGHATAAPSAEPPTAYAAAPTEDPAPTAPAEAATEAAPTAPPAPPAANEHPPPPPPAAAKAVPDEELIGEGEEEGEFAKARRRAEARRAAEEAEVEAARLAEEARQQHGAPVETEAPKTVHEFYRPKAAEPVYPGGFYKRELRFNNRRPAPSPSGPNRF